LSHLWNPGCEIQSVCRACGAELSNLRATLEQRSDTNPIAANTVREEIGHALADKIRQSESAADLKLVIHEILPVAERFLETAEEKRLRGERIELENAQTALRRARRGTVVAAIGFAAALVFLVAGLASRDPAWLVPGIPSIISFLIGIGILLNGLFFTALPAKAKDPPRRSLEEVMWGKKKLGPANPLGQSSGKKELSPADPSGMPSVTEGTTRQL
jgi:hypothetical protein